MELPMRRIRVNNWLPNNQQVIILPGERAELIALSHNLYRCQNDRTFRPSRYVAFYRRGVIKYLFEIVDGPCRNCMPDNTPELQQVSRYRNINEPGLVMFLKFIAEVGPIQNDTIAETGRGIAFARSQRYTTYDKIMRARLTSEL
jgi:hypothetical protein